MDNTQPVLVTPKPWYTSKTVIFAILTGLSGVVIALESVYPAAGILVTIASAINVILRFGVSAPLQ